MERKIYTSQALWEKLKPLAREKRHEPTLAEEKLWISLRNKGGAGAKFGRQHPISKFIVDFYCAKGNLVIEVDGEIHQYTVEEDAVRQEFLESHGLKVLRFSNHEILTSIDTVLARISAALGEH